MSSNTITGYWMNIFMSVVKLYLMFEKTEKKQKEAVDRPFSCFSKSLTTKLCGQSYKASTLVIYDSTVIPDLTIPHITTLGSYITSVNCL